MEVIARVSSAPLIPGKTYFPEPTDEAIGHAADLIAASERPLILAGNGVLRRNASPELRAFARGMYGFGPHTEYHTLPPSEHMAAANARVHVTIMLETRRGFDRLDEIASVPGIDALLIGTNGMLFSPNDYGVKFRSDVITGPGNVYVAIAKRLLADTPLEPARPREDVDGGGARAPSGTGWSRRLARMARRGTAR